MSARHRSPAGTATATQCSARELIDRLGCPDTPGRAARRHYKAEPAPGRVGTPRPPARQSTLAMLAVGAVGAGTAATGVFSAITDHEPAAPAPVAFDALATAAVTSASAPTSAASAAMVGDALVSASSPGDARPALASAPAVASPATLTDSLPAAAPSSTAATVLAEDTHQMDVRQIAALSRSVDLENAPKPTVPRPAALGLPGGGIEQAPGAARRASAVSMALGKLGVPYVWGAAGPNAFDCSGLVQWVFKKAGLNLPRTSRAQSAIGTPVSRGDLRPGDLVFFYTPVSHVGIYLGNGKVVHASEPGKPVKISQMSRMPFHNARRV